MRYEFNGGTVRVEKCGIKRKGNGAGGLIGAILIVIERGSGECEKDSARLADLIYAIENAKELRLEPHHSERCPVVLLNTNMYAAKTSAALAALLVNLFRTTAISTDATDPFQIISVRGPSLWTPFEEISRDRIVMV